MASQPALANGFVQIDVGLYAALGTTHFSDRERAVWTWLTLHSWSARKQEFVWVSHADVERFFSLDRRNSRRGLETLIKRNIVIKRDDESVKPNRHYEEWKAEPSVRDKVLKAAKSALALFGSSSRAFGMNPDASNAKANDRVHRAPKTGRSCGHEEAPRTGVPRGRQGRP